MTEAVTPNSGWGEPLARFHTPICIGSAGLDKPTLEQIGQRLAQDAVKAGIPLAGPHCTANVMIMFVDKVDTEIVRLRRASPGLFGDRTPSEVDALLKQPGPVRAWSITETRSSEGDPIRYSRRMNTPIASIIVKPTRRDVLGSVIVVERSAALGKTTDQLGDYLAMRALTPVRPQGAEGKDTILALFDAGSPHPPTAMTAFDRGYLQGLYAAEANADASTTKKVIVHAIRQAESGAKTEGTK